MVVETVGLTKRYGALDAVSDLCIEVPRGGVFGFLGPNGSGKSTTIGMLLGLVRPTRGSVRVFGESVPGGRLPEVLRRVGASVEAPAFYPYLSGRSNLRFFQRLGRGGTAREVEHLLALVGLTDAADRRVDTYSMGMKQRLAIARALLGEPELILLDEPTNGLDPAGVAEMRKLFLRLGGEGRTVVLSSHQLFEVEQVCSRVAILSHGRLLAHGVVAELLPRGGGYRLRTTDDTSARRVLHGIEWVRIAPSDGGTITVDLREARPGDLTRVLSLAGVFVTELTPIRPSLESFFLELTGGVENRGEEGAEA